MEENGQIVKQNELKVIHCDRCGKDFTRFTHLRRHFHNKRVCKPVLKNIPIEELIEKYKVRKGCYKCENCGKEYKSKVGKCNHKKKCLLNPVIIEKKEKEILANELEIIKQEKKELEKQLVLQSSIDASNAKIINNNNQSHNNNSLNTVNVVINNYGQEKEMTEKEIKRLVEVALKKCNNIRGVPWDALTHVLQQKHFNPKYPENQNLKLTNISSPIMDVYTNDKWRKVPFSDQVKIIIESLMEFIESKHHLVDISKNYWEELYDKLEDFLLKGENKKYYNKVETSMRCQLYNETQDIIEHNKIKEQNIKVN